VIERPLVWAAAAAGLWPWRSWASKVLGIGLVPVGWQLGFPAQVRRHLPPRSSPMGGWPNFGFHAVRVMELVARPTGLPLIVHFARGRCLLNRYLQAAEARATGVCCSSLQRRGGENHRHWRAPCAAWRERGGRTPTASVADQSSGASPIGFSGRSGGGSAPVSCGRTLSWQGKGSLITLEASPKQLGRSRRGCGAGDGGSGPSAGAGPGSCAGLG